MWGKSISIDLYDCDPALISNEKEIKKFVKELISVINMVSHGPCYVERFGSAKLEGISAMQFIETSSVTVHCDEVEKKVFIDIFSCKDFDNLKARTFSKRFFKAKRVRSVTLIR